MLHIPAMTRAQEETKPNSIRSEQNNFVANILSVILIHFSTNIHWENLLHFFEMQTYYSVIYLFLYQYSLREFACLISLRDCQSLYHDGVRRMKQNQITISITYSIHFTYLISLRDSQLLYHSSNQKHAIGTLSCTVQKHTTDFNITNNQNSAIRTLKFRQPIGSPGVG